MCVCVCCRGTDCRAVQLQAGSHSGAHCGTESRPPLQGRSHDSHMINHMTRSSPFQILKALMATLQSYCELFLKTVSSRPGIQRIQSVFTHTHTSLTHSSLSHTYTLFLSLLLSLSHTLSLTHTHSPLSHTHTHSLSLSLSLSHTHTHTHTHTVSLPISLRTNLLRDGASHFGSVSSNERNSKVQS